MKIRSLLAAVVAALLVAACGNGGDGDGGAANGDDGGDGGGVTIGATEFAFDPEDFSLPADTDTEVTLRNDGVVEHDLTVDDVGIDIYVDAGETVTETVNVPAGTYTFYCSIPGHREGGMEGTLTVS